MVLVDPNGGGVQLPAAYIALYPYKPHKPDELELRKGGIYMVVERCQDGWFKGKKEKIFSYITVHKMRENCSVSPVMPILRN